MLYDLAGSSNIWEQRIAIVSTLALIRDSQFDDTLKIAGTFLTTEHDLIRKATGWMLREVGKKDESVLSEFLEKYRTVMPRSMLRYAIERFSPERRRYFMGKAD